MLFVVCLLVATSSLFARVTGDSLRQYRTPFLLSSAGQGPGAKMLRLLLIKEGTLSFGKDFFLEDEPEPRLQLIQEQDYSALVLVIGTTEKGLGASGETLADEKENLKVLVADAKAKGIPIVAMSIEEDKRGNGRTNDENEEIIDLVCPHADWIIALKKNNKDKRFTTISKKYGIPLTIVASALELASVCPQIFDAGK